MVDENLDLALDQQASGLGRSHIEDRELGAVRDVLLAAAREVVHNQDVVAGRHQSLGDVAADEAGTTGDADG